MNWICANDFSSNNWLESNQNTTKQSNAFTNSTRLLARGSIVVEFDIGTEGRIPTRLVHFQSDENWHRRFTIFLNADFSVSVEVQQGSAHSYVCLSDWRTARTKRARLTYAWDGPAKLGLLTIECLATGQISQTIFNAPVPIPQADAERTALVCNDTQHDPRLLSVALSDAIEPIGPAPSIATGTIVDTAEGPRAIERLQLGDKILTASHDMQPVRWIVSQEFRAVGNYRAIKLRAPYLDLKQDIIVSQNQRIQFSGAEAEYLFGEDAVLVEARQLLGHVCATLMPTGTSRRYYQVLLDNHDCIRLNGAWSESLHIGHIASVPEVLATSRLSMLTRSALPVHRKFVRPILRSYETRTLLDSLIA